MRDRNLASLLERAKQLLSDAERGASRVEYYNDVPYVDDAYFAEIRTASLSFIALVFGDRHPYYTEFSELVKSRRQSNAHQAVGVLKAIVAELEGGWIQTTRGLVSAEVFADFLEMAAHFLDEGYKDAAAVMVGGVLEEHLRQLAAKYGGEIVDGSGRPLKAERLNQDLTKRGAYNLLVQKQVTAWLGLRNDAAHANYTAYDHAQVQQMLSGVRDFLIRISL